MDPTNGKLRVMAEITQTPVPWNVEKSAALRDQRQTKCIRSSANLFLPFLIQHMFTQLPQICPLHAINISISYRFSSRISKTLYHSPSEHKA